MIFGLGTDITEIDRIEEMIKRHGDHFLNRTYTSVEIEYCQRHKSAAQHFAGRWAAKEAVMKAFGTGFVKGVGWTDIEIQSLPSGRPVVVLSGGTKELADEVGISSVMISISHGKSYATATAIAIKDAD